MTALVTAYFDHHRALLPYSLPPLLTHAERHGHDVVLAHRVEGVHHDFSKVLALRAALTTHDIAVWVDADSHVLHDAGDLGKLVTVSWMALGYGYSSALWALRRDPRSIALLDRLWDARSNTMLDNEQGMLWEILGPTPPSGTAVFDSVPPHCESPGTGVVHVTTSQGHNVAEAAEALRRLNCVDVSARDPARAVRLRELEHQFIDDVWMSPAAEQGWLREPEDQVWAIPDLSPRG